MIIKLHLSQITMKKDLKIFLRELKKILEEISSVALLSPGCFLKLFIVTIEGLGPHEKAKKPEDPSR